MGGARQSAWRLKFHKQLAAAVQQPCDAREQPYRRAADADVAVEKKGAAPTSARRHLVEDVADDCPSPASDGELDRDRGEVDAEREHSASRECMQVATRSAAHVQYGAGEAVEELLVGRIGRAQITLEWKRDGCTVDESRARP